MTTSVLPRQHAPADRAPAVEPRPAASTASLVLLASIVVSFLAGSAAPTPLYAVYQSEWGFSPITTTVVFASYAAAVLAALLTLGKVSDHVGRRPVLLAAVAAQIVTMLIFALAGGVPELLLARVLQGLATGAALGALGAAMIDIDRDRGTFANAVVPGIGTALGALVSGLVVQYLPAPEHLIYLALLVIFVAQGFGVVFLRETVDRAPGALASLVPDIKLPRATRRPILAAAPVLFAVWALAGFYASLAPALTRQLTGSSSVVFGGLGLFLLASVAVLATVIVRNVAAQTVLVGTALAVVVGVAIVLAAVHAGSAWLFFAGTAVAGFGFGSGFQGSIRSVVPLAAAHERSGVLSLLFVVSYVGFGAPAVAAGFLVADVTSLSDTAIEYGTFVIVLAVVAMISLTRTPERKPA